MVLRAGDDRRRGLRPLGRDRVLGPGQPRGLARLRAHREGGAHPRLRRRPLLGRGGRRPRLRLDGRRPLHGGACADRERGGRRERDRRQAGRGRPARAGRRAGQARLGRDRRRRRPQRAHGGRLPGARRAIRPRAGAARAPRGRLHPGAPLLRRALRGQPLRLRRRPARRPGDPRARARAARPSLLDGRPQPLGAVRRRHRVRPVARRRTHPGEPRASSASRRATSRATGPTRSCSTRFAASCARAPATPGSATRRAGPRSRSSSTGTARNDRPRLRGLDRRRPRRPPLRRAPEDGPLRAGDHRHLGRAPGPGHRLDQADALPGRHGRPGAALGIRRGRHGDGQLRDRRRGPRGGRGARLRRSRCPRSSPERASRSRTAPRSAPAP